MKKFTSLFLFILFGYFAANALTWQKLDLTKAGGGTINLNISRMVLENGKLYAATYDGIWVSPSGNGGDWEPFGLQGEKVTRLSFGNLKLALVLVTASNDATKTTSVLYKLNGSTWELTNLNPDKLSTFGSAYSEFTQIRDQNGNDIILYPTWGNGIWRSDDGGATWTNYPQADTEHGKVYKNVLGLHVFPGDNIVYGTDKVANNNNYLIYSEDYGATWQYKHVGKFFNPYAVYARTYNDKKYIYYGGQNGSDGAIWRSEDMGTTWEASLSAGVEYWECRKITGSPNGNLYSMASINNLYVSKDNGDTFEVFATGLSIPSQSDRIANPPAADKVFLTDVIATDTIVYLSTAFREGIYVVDLETSLANVSKNAVSYTIKNNLLQVNTSENCNIQILNLTGVQVSAYKAHSGVTTIDITNLTPGVYFLKVKNADNSITINKFIKK